MRALLQRVPNASVTVNGKILSQIDAGLLVLVCAMDGDDDATAQKLANKVSKLRLFADDAGKTNRSILDTGGQALVVSQFTLAADTSRGNRPGFSRAAPPDIGRTLYEAFADNLSDLGIPTQRGQFGADMAVALINDGPMTLWLGTDD